MPIHGSYQEAGVAGSKALASDKSVERMFSNDEIKDASKAKSKSMSWIMDTNSASEIDRKILSRNVATLTNLGVLEQGISSDKVLRRAKKDDAETKETEESSKDKTELSKNAFKAGSQIIMGIKKRLGGGTGGFGGGGSGGEETEAEKMLDMFREDFTKSIITNDPKEKARLKHNLLDIEAKLKGKGVSPEELHGITVQMRNAARQEIMKSIKEAFLQKFATPQKTLEWTIRQNGVNQILNFAFLNQDLGGYGFGGTTLGAIMRRESDNAQEKMGATVLNELESELIRNSINPSQDKLNTINDLGKLAMQCGVDLNKWLESFQKKFQNLGCSHEPFIADMNKEKQDSSNNEHGKRKKQDGIDEIDEAEEKEVLVDEVRGIFIERFVNNDIKTTFNTAFKLRALTRRLKDYKISEEQLKQIKAEARKVAGFKIVAMIKDAYFERVVMLPDSGARVKLVTKRINKLMKRAKELGMELTDDEIESIRAEVEQTVYNNAMSKLLLLQSLGDNKDAKQSADEKYLFKLVKNIEGIWGREEQYNETKERKHDMLRSIYQRMTKFRYTSQKV